MENQEKSLMQLTSELEEYKAECKKAQEVLNKCRDRYFPAMDAVPDPIVFYDVEGKVTYLNPAFTQLFGWDLDDLLNKKIDFVPEQNIKETQEGLRRMLKGEKILSLETRRFTSDGKILNIQLSSSAYKDHCDKVIGSIVIYRDITEKKKIEVMLLESEKKYRSAMEAAADPIIVYDNEGLVTYFNPAFSRVFKWSLEERINKKMDDFVPEKNWPETKKMIDMVVVGKFFSSIETARYDKNGNIIPVSISGSTYQDEDNQVIGSVINIQDISERKQAQKTLKDKEKLKGALEMAGAVCHELSQPAMIIAGYSKILSMNITKDNPLYDKVDKIKEQVDRIGALTKKLMNITKYKTREYSKGKKIVDIDKASQE